MGDPMQLTVRGCHLSIRRADASLILIRIAAAGTPRPPEGRTA
jgi:Fe2+ transport system protein FeoA